MATSPIRPPTDSFWCRPLETAPRERILEMQWQRLRSLLRYANERSPFYRDLFRRIGAEPGDFRTLDQFKREFPKTDKKDFLHFQAEQPHYGRTLAVSEAEISMHAETSGSTGLKLHIPYTLYDTERYGESWIYGWWALGIRPTDSFYFAFNWGTFAGFWSAYWGVRRLGATVYSGGGQSTSGHIEQIIRLKPTVVLATPTYAVRLAEEAVKMGVDLPSSAVRFTYHAGEPGPTALPALRRQLEEAWGAVAGETLGVAELDAMAPNCPLGRGVHMNELNCFSWSCDPVDDVEVAEGEVGENVVTSFVQNAQPLINYRTHDLVRAYHRLCDCGRTWRYFDGSVLGRSDFMITVKGTNVYPTAVEVMVTETPGVSPYYQVLLDRLPSGLEELTVRAEADPKLPKSEYVPLAERLARRLKDSFEVRIPVEIVDPETLPRFELKTKRIIDRRPEEFRRQLDR